MEGMTMTKTFIKPNMTNLKGRTGRHILDTIKNSKPSSHKKLKYEADKAMNEILELKRNGE